MEVKFKNYFYHGGFKYSSQKVKPKLYAHDPPTLTLSTFQIIFLFSFYFETNLNLGTSF